MFHMRNKPTADWLGQRGGRGDHRGAGLIPYRVVFFACFCFACVCMALCGTCTLVLGRVFSVFPSMARFVFLRFVERALDA